MCPCVTRVTILLYLRLVDLHIDICVDVMIQSRNGYVLIRLLCFMLYTMARKLTSTLFNKGKTSSAMCLTITKMELWESKWKVYQANTCYKIWILLISNHFDVRHAKEAPESSSDSIYNQFSGNGWESCKGTTCALPEIQDYSSTFVDWTKIGSFWIRNFDTYHFFAEYSCMR